MSETVPDNLEIPSLVLANKRQQRGALKFGEKAQELLLAVPALPEPGDIPSPPAHKGERGTLFIPSGTDTLCLAVEVKATAIDHVTLTLLELSPTDQARLRERVRGSPEDLHAKNPKLALTEEQKKGLLEQTNHFILSELSGLFTEIFDALIADLQTSSLNPKLLQAQQELMFEGMRQAEIVKPRMLELLTRDLQRRLEGQTEKRTDTSRKRIGQYTHDELDLVDLKEFEESLAVKRLLRLSDDYHRGVFELMTLRYAALKGTKPRVNLLPVSLNVLVPSLKRSLNQRELPTELGHRLFEFSGNLLLRKAKTLYANVNLFLKQAGLEPGLERRLESGAPLLPAAPAPAKNRPNKLAAEPQLIKDDQTLDLSAQASTLASDDLVTLRVAKKKAAFIERLMTSMGDQVDPESFSDQLVSDMFLQVKKDSNLNPAMRIAIETLREPIQLIARQDPSFLVDNHHPMRRAFDQLTQLARSDLYPNPKLQEGVVDLIEQIQRSQTIDDALAKQLADQTEAIQEQQRRHFLRNIDRLRQVEQGQVRYRDARLDTLKILQDTLPDQQMPLSLAELIANGWLELLTLNRLRSHNPELDSSRLNKDVRCILAALSRGVNDQPSSPSALAEASQLLDRIEQEITDTLPTRTNHAIHLSHLKSEITGNRQIVLVNIYDTGLFSELTSSNIIERLRSLPRLNRLVRRALSIPIATWLSDRNQERRHYLAWHDEAQEHYVFANERGQKITDVDLLGFARLLHRGLHPLRPIEALPLLDRHLLRKVQEFVPRRIQHPNYHNNSTALTDGSLAQQAMLSSQQAFEQGHSVHLVLLTAANVDLVASLYDAVIIQAYEDCLIQAITEHLRDDHVLGRLNVGKIGVIFLGESTVSVRKRLVTISKDLNKRSITTGAESLPLEVQWSTLQLDSPLETLEHTQRALQLLGNMPASASATLSDLQRDLEPEKTQRRPAFDHTKVALLGFHSQWRQYESNEAHKRLDFTLIDLEQETPITDPYGLYQPETHPEIDRWRLKTAFAWLQSMAEQEREIPNCVIDIANSSLGDIAFCDAVLDDISEYGVGTNKLYFRIDLQHSQASLEAIQEFTQVLSDIGCRIIGSNVLNADPQLLTSVNCDLFEISLPSESLLDESRYLQRLDGVQLLGRPVVYFNRHVQSPPPEALRFALTGEETGRSEPKPMNQIARELGKLKH